MAGYLAVVFSVILPFPFGLQIVHVSILSRDWKPSPSDYLSNHKLWFLQPHLYPGGAGNHCTLLLDPHNFFSPLFMNTVPFIPGHLPKEISRNRQQSVKRKTLLSISDKNEVAVVWQGDHTSQQWGLRAGRPLHRKYLSEKQDGQRKQGFGEMVLETLILCDLVPRIN